MRSPCRPRLLGLAVAALLTPGALQAQDVIGPAFEVRVVERGDPIYGVVRQVVDDPSPSEVLRVQIELARNGHDPGVRNGVLDRPTRRALAAFQAERGLVVCSCLSYETVVALGIAPVVVAREDASRRRASVVYVESWPRWSHSRLRGHGSAVFVGHVPDGIHVGHEPVGRGVDRRPQRPPGRSRPARPEPPDRGAAPRPEPRSGGRIRGAEPVPVARPDDARPSRPGGRIAGPGASRPAPPSRPALPAP